MIPCAPKRAGGGWTSEKFPDMEILQFWESGPFMGQPGMWYGYLMKTNQSQMKCKISSENFYFDLTVNNPN